MTNAAKNITNLHQNGSINSIDVFFQFCPIPIIFFDKNWRVSKWSRRAQEVFLWEENEVIGKSVDEIHFVFEQDNELFQKVIFELATRDNCRSKNRNYKKDGAIVVCEWINVKYSNENGEILGYLNFCQDITELEENKILIEEIQHYFKTFFNSIPIPVIYLNDNLKIENSNSAFQKIFQIYSNILLHNKLTEILPVSQNTLQY
ncbi:MAG TPA: PAS domain-containing protein, partial [Candidatus Kapabacteria bacterium]|nr:PAS domain-containing protein [Candidatus Kapabacteria bacterium]